MLSDEEREVIEKIQNRNKIGIYELIRTFKREGIENFITVRRKYIDIMINIIEKQSKEIEELKKYEKYYEEMEEVNKKFIAVEQNKYIDKLEKEISKRQWVHIKENGEIEPLFYISKNKIRENNRLY